jgi:phosphoglycolate phosphatase
MAAIIFDFDGTIADSFDYVADFLAAQAKLHLNDERRLSLRGMSMIAMARQLGYRWWQLPGLFFKGRRRMIHVVMKLKPFEGMPELIRKLHAEGHELFLLSSNSVRNVHKFLHHHKLHEYFLEIYGGVGLFDKAPAMRRLLKEHSLEAENAVYVGDELRDVEAAQSIGLRVVAVSWGFARTKILKDQKPTALVSSPDELMSVLEQL